MNLPPGPRSTLELMRTLVQRTKDPIRFYKNIFQKYGGIVFFQLGPYKFAMLNDADAIHEVLHKNAGLYTKSTGYERFKLILGNGLLISEGEVWKKQRRLMSWAFASKHIERVFPVMVSETRDMLKSWEGKTEVDLALEMNSVTLQVISQSLFGKRHQGGDSLLVRRSLQNILEYLQTTRHLWIQLLIAPLPIRDKRRAALKIEASLPLRDTRTFFSSIEKLDQLVEEMITEGRAQKGSENFLDTMISATDSEDHTQMDNQQLRDEVISVLVAGHETTANALTWTWHLLLAHPEVLGKVTEEVGWVVSGEAPKFDELSALTYTKAVLEESMRLYPPFWRISRKNAEDATVGGYRIPANTTVIAAIFSIQRNPTYWERPEEFLPERFLEKGRSENRFAYIPFGAGPRACVGSQFAMVEALTILSICIKAYRFERTSPTFPELFTSLTLQPKGGCKVTLKKRGA